MGVSDPSDEERSGGAVNKMHIPSRLLSIAFWGAIERYGRPPLEAFEACEKNRPQADNDTGTVSLTDATSLWRLARCFRPNIIAEVGTFIGTSATALRLGSGGIVYTCDRDNDCFEMPGVVTHPKHTSTQLFEILKERSVKVDMFFIDGKIANEDIALINAIKTPDTVFVFDDYEGVEKGVMNVARMQPVLRANVFMQPIADGLAVSLPAVNLAITTQ